LFGTSLAYLGAKRKLRPVDRFAGKEGDPIPASTILGRACEAGVKNNAQRGAESERLGKPGSNQTEPAKRAAAITEVAEVEEQISGCQMMRFRWLRAVAHSVSLIQNPFTHAIAIQR
jgi:hypothetical protein